MDFFRLFSDLNSIIVRAPGAEQTAIPPFCSDGQEKRGGWQEREKLVKGRIVCQCHPCFLLRQGKFVFLTETLKFVASNEKSR